MKLCMYLYYNLCNFFLILLFNTNCKKNVVKPVKYFFLIIQYLSYLNYLYFFYSWNKKCFSWALKF